MGLGSVSRVLGNPMFLQRGQWNIFHNPVVVFYFDVIFYVWYNVVKFNNPLLM